MKTVFEFYRIYKKPSRIILFLTLVLSSSLYSCQDELEIFEIQRLGVFSYSIDSLNTEIADDVYFYQGKTSIYEYENGISEVYTRFLLEARVTSLEGHEVIIDIEFDIIPDGDFIDIYHIEYKPNIGGIYSFSYLEKIDNDTYKSYNLDVSAASSTFLRVKRQNNDEYLILGDFFAVLQNDKDSSDKIVLSEGVFEDILYKLY